MKATTLIITILINMLALNAEEQNDYDTWEPRYFLSVGYEVGGFHKRVKDNPIELYENPSLKSKVIKKIPRSDGYWKTVSKNFGPFPAGRDPVGTLIAAIDKKGDFYLVHYGGDYYWVHRGDFLSSWDIERYFNTRASFIWLHFSRVKEGMIYTAPNGEAFPLEKFNNWKRFLLHKNAAGGSVQEFKIVDGKAWVKLRFEGHLGDHPDDTIPTMNPPRYLWFKPYDEKGRAKKGWGYGFK